VSYGSFLRAQQTLDLADGFAVNPVKDRSHNELASMTFLEATYLTSDKEI